MNNSPLDIKVNYFPYAKASKDAPAYTGEKRRLIDILKNQHELFSSRIDALRSLKDHKLRNEYKASKLPCYYVSCLLENEGKGSRSMDHINYHTNLVVLDLDNCSTKMQSIKKSLMELPEVAYCSKSCSGNGLFAIFYISDSKYHEYCYKETFPKLCDMLGIEQHFDTTGKNINRLRYVTNDIDYYLNINPKALTFNSIKYHYINKSNIESSKINKQNSTCLLENSIRRIKNENIDLVNNYNDWMRIGFALTELGESGRKYYHEISKINYKYNKNECDLMYDKLLKHKTGRIKLNTLWWYLNKFQNSNKNSNP